MIKYDTDTSAYIMNVYTDLWRNTVF